MFFTGLFFFRLAYTACIGIIWGFLPVLGAGELSLSSSSIGILVMLAIFVSGIIHVPMGYLADRINKKLMVVSGGLIAGLGLGLIWSRICGSTFTKRVSGSGEFLSAETGSKVKTTRKTI